MQEYRLSDALPQGADVRHHERILRDPVALVMERSLELSEIVPLVGHAQVHHRHDLLLLLKPEKKIVRRRKGSAGVSESGGEGRVEKIIVTGGGGRIGKRRKKQNVLLVLIRGQWAGVGGMEGGSLQG